MIVAGTVYPEHLTLRQIMLFKKICSTDSMKESARETQQSVRPGQLESSVN